jgi:hypothetical protein
VDAASAASLNCMQIHFPPTAQHSANYIGSGSLPSTYMAKVASVVVNSIRIGPAPNLISVPLR